MFCLKQSISILTKREVQRLDENLARCKDSLKINYQLVSISISILYIKKDNWAACVKQNNTKKIKIVKAR